MNASKFVLLYEDKYGNPWMRGIDGDTVEHAQQEVIRQVTANEAWQWPHGRRHDGFLILEYYLDTPNCDDSIPYMVYGYNPGRGWGHGPLVVKAWNVMLNRSPASQPASQPVSQPVSQPQP